MVADCLFEYFFQRTGKVENNGELPVEKSKITDVQVSKKSTNKTDDLVEAECVNDATNLVFGYLNLFSDAVVSFHTRVSDAM